MLKSRIELNNRYFIMYKLAVIGNPIAHSLSPLIWSEFAHQCEIELEYNKICAPIDDFEHVVRDFFASGGHALSVTAPFKSRAYALANRHNSHTLLSQTANHLIARDGLLLADNTDGIGLVADLHRMGRNLKSKNILIIGSGSVIYSVLSSLEAEAPKRIDLLMRDSSKLDDFIQKSRLVDAYDAVVSYDIVINTTPNIAENTLFSQVKQLSAHALVYDMIYTAKQTLFLKAMEQVNADITQANGLGMLIQQAAAAFTLIFAKSPNIDALYPLLQEKMNG